MIINAETEDFIKAHANDNIRQLALKKTPEGVDITFALTQIDGRQRAMKKLPKLAAVDGIIYPPHISMEQCSSEITAEYKADLAKKLGGKTFADLTGGFGIDFIYMSNGFSEATYVERQEILCATAQHNFGILGMSNCKIVNGDGTEYLNEMQSIDTIYLDPARRDKSGSRTFVISDCTPDVSALLPLLKHKAHNIIIKLSPMLDWRKAVSDLGNSVSEVHIVSAEGECKELLLVVGSEIVTAPTIHCVNLATKEKVFVTTAASPHLSPKERGLDYLDMAMTTTALAAPSPWGRDGERLLFLFLPNPSIMKAGCFAEICGRYGVQQVADNSHIFLSDNDIKDFPGKSYHIIDISTMNKRELRQKLSGITRANIATRNFPMTAVELRKRLKLADGGDIYIFATTNSSREHILFICRRVY